MLLPPPTDPVTVVLSLVVLALLGAAGATFAFFRGHRRTIETLTQRVQGLSDRVRALEHRIAASTGEPASRRDPSPSDESNRRPPSVSAPSGPRRQPSRPVEGEVSTLIAVPSLRPLVTEVNTEAHSDLAERFSGIWDLANAGASADEIAAQTGQPVGQVELILALRRRAAEETGSLR